MGRPPPGPRPVLWPPANFSPQCTQLMSSSQQSRAECWQQSRESNCCQVSPSLPTGSAASRGGGRRKDCQFEIFNSGLCDLKGVAFKKEYCIRAPSKRGRYWEIHPQCQREFLRPERCPKGNLEGRGGGFPNNSQVLVEYGHFIHHQSFPRKCLG